MKKREKRTEKGRKGEYKNLNNFSWQRGYGCFSVSPKDLKVLIEYIENQKEHNKKLTFQDEFRKFLKNYGVQYDESYIWD